MAFADIRQDILDGLVSNRAEIGGWNALRSQIPVTAVVRTSDTVVTITLPALVAYEIRIAETITATIPASALAGGVAIVASPTATVAASARWLTQARAGIERAGVSRARGMLFFPMITIGGVDVTSQVQWGSVDIEQNLNDDPDTARFTLVPGATVPSIGETVLIGVSGTQSAEFGGQIVRTTRRKLRVASGFVTFIDCECVDWLRLFDRRLITFEYHSTSATDIVNDVIANWTSGFDDKAVVPGLTLAVSDSIVPFVNTRPSEALRTIANLLGPSAGFYIDPDRVVHFFGPSGEDIYKPTAPVTLTDTLGTLKTFEARYDGTQIRTRVKVEGQQTTVPLGVDINGGTVYIPVEDGSVFDPTADITNRCNVRIGAETLLYDGVSTFGDFNGNRPGSTLTADVAAGATELFLADSTWAAATGWVKAGDQFIRYTAKTDGTGRLYNIPATGYGAIIAPLSSSSEVSACDVLLLDKVPSYSQQKGSEAVAYVVANDTAAQTVVAAAEGGDGIHEHLVSDGRVSAATASLMAESELDLFADPLITATWDTDDLNARPGRVQVIAFTDPAMSAQLTIIRASVRWLTEDSPPLRTCESATVKTAGILEMLRATGQSYATQLIANVRSRR